MSVSRGDPNHELLLSTAFANESERGTLRQPGLERILDSLGLGGTDKRGVVRGVWDAMNPVAGGVSWDAFRAVMMNITNAAPTPTASFATNSPSSVPDFPHYPHYRRGGSGGAGAGAGAHLNLSPTSQPDPDSPLIRGTTRHHAPRALFPTSPVSSPALAAGPDASVLNLEPPPATAAAAASGLYAGGGGGQAGRLFDSLVHRPPQPLPVTDTEAAARDQRLRALEDGLREREAALVVREMRLLGGGGGGG
eukprot:Rhum_TRINITY_DN14689_c49_g1::Rhum_TRINITY_DN14689_c49_g1_i1::g.110002::m.110002